MDVRFHPASERLLQEPLYKFPPLSDATLPAVDVFFLCEVQSIQSGLGAFLV